MAVVAVALASLAPVALRAEAPIVSPRPEVRSVGAVASAPAPAVPRLPDVAGQAGLLRAPAAAGEAARTASVAGLFATVPSPAVAGVARSLRPRTRPAVVARPDTRRVARTVALSQGRKVLRRGALCGDPDIQGAEIAAIAGRLRGCGVEAPVRVAAVAGVPLSQAATMDCTTAKALKGWVERGVVPAVGRMGGGVAGLRVVAHYACRPRNNQRGAKLSEHARGRAVDVAAITLVNGSEISVLKGWRDRRQGPVLRRMHAAACGPFGTVLGPDANRYHADHFHFDTARYRSGAYCR